MKKVIFSLLVVFLMNYSFAQDTLDHFKVYGNISHHDEMLDAAKIELFDGDDLINTYSTNKKGHFEIHLLEDKNYTLKVEKENFITKKIEINTMMLKHHEPHKKEHQLHFNCHMERFPKNATLEEMKELDHPFAILNYDQESRNFEWDERYTKRMELLEKKLSRKH